MKPIQLYRTEGGKIVDEDGVEYQLPHKEEGAISNQLYRSKGLDIEGGVTITGNLTVQQSDWVYLRGPITGSGALINGPITASALWIRNTTGEGLGEMEGMGYLKVDEDIEVRGVSYWKVFGELRKAVRELRSKVESLERKIDGNKK